MNELQSSIEAVLFAAGEPMPLARLSLVLGVDEGDVAFAAAALGEHYQRQGSALRLLRLGDKLQLCTAPEYATLITRALERRKPPMLSPSALEVLAIVAYFQPVTRAYIDQVRGVDSSYTVSALTERGLIEVSGRLEVPGRPALFQTTDLFLRTMGIQQLEELPVLPDLTCSEGVEKLQKTIEELDRAEASPEN